MKLKLKFGNSLNQENFLHNLNVKSYFVNFNGVDRVRAGKQFGLSFFSSNIKLHSFGIYFYETSNLQTLTHTHKKENRKKQQKSRIKVETYIGLTIAFLLAFSM